MEPSTRTLAPITSTNEAKASMSTASSTASRTSDSPSKSPLWRLPPDVLTNLQPSYWTRRSSHGPPDGGPAGAVPPAGFVLGKIQGISGIRAQMGPTFRTDSDCPGYNEQRFFETRRGQLAFDSR